MRPRRKAEIAAGLLATVLAVVVPSTAAAADEDCLAHVVTDAKMAVGRPGTVSRSVSLPPGDVTMTVRTWDGYDERADAEQPGERVEILLLSGGTVVASSGVTPDLADLVRDASWSAGFGPVSAPTGVDTIVIEHRPSDTGSPDSLWAEVTVCVEEPPPPTTEATTTTTTAAPTTTEAPPTTAPPTSTPPTTQPEVTATSEVIEPTTTVAPTTAPPTTAPPATAPSTTDGVGVASEETSVATTAPQPLQELPRTGATTNVLALVGIALVGVGGSLVLVSRRPVGA